MTALTLRVERTALRRGLYLLNIAAVTALAWGIMIPYFPKELPGWAGAHTLCATGSCVLMMTGLLLLLLHFRSAAPAPLRPLLTGWAAVALGTGILFLLAGVVTCAMEIYFTLSAALLLHWTRLRGKFFLPQPCD